MQVISISTRRASHDAWSVGAALMINQIHVRLIRTSLGQVPAAGLHQPQGEHVFACMCLHGWMCCTACTAYSQPPTQLSTAMHTAAAQARCVTLLHTQACTQQRPEHHPPHPWT